MLDNRVEIRNFVLGSTYSWIFSWNYWNLRGTSKRNLLDLELVVSYGVTCFNHTIPQVKCGILCSLEITFVGMFSVTLLTEKRIQSAEQRHD